MKENCEPQPQFHSQTQILISKAYNFRTRIDKEKIEMSTEAANDELRAAIERGDVQAVDRALQSGVAPDFEIGSNPWTKSTLLYFAAEVSVLYYSNL